METPVAIPPMLSEEEILKPYLEREYGPRNNRRSLGWWIAYVETELRTQPWGTLHKHKKMQIKAVDLILAFFERLLAVGGDPALAGPTPKQVPGAYFGFLFGWLGGGKNKPTTSDDYDAIEVTGMPISTFPWVDGVRVQFDPAAIGSQSDDRAIAEGCTDLIGKKWAPFNEGVPSWNRAEMDGLGISDRALGKQRNRDYRGSYRFHWTLMRDEDFRDACLETHGEADFEGLPRNITPHLTR